MLNRFEDFGWKHAGGWAVKITDKVGMNIFRSLINKCFLTEGSIGRFWQAYFVSNGIQY